MNIGLNISTCPNDTFMFDALLHGRIDTEGLTFTPHLADIEELNETALRGEVQVTKLSYGVYPLLQKHYRILSSGSALGRGNGPLLVSRKGFDPAQLSSARVAVPGLHTTANLLLDKLYPQITQKTPLLFSEIALAVLSGEFDAGVLIHEGRFTYQELGLELIADLGVRWEQEHSLMLPLGAIVASRSLDEATQRSLDRVLRRSVRYGMDHPEVSRAFVRSHARELSDEVIDAHIALFVNDYSIDLGEQGRAAVQGLLSGVNEEDFL